jgi:putative PIN family toxin of toxin-antitoxin system
MKLCRVTLDTDVLVAGLRSRNGASFQVLSHWVEGTFLACASVPIWLEYEATLKRADLAAIHGLSNGEVDILLATWAVNVAPVELHFTWRPQLRDPKEEMVLETALNARAEALVTFNEGDFSFAAKLFRLPIWRPRDLLQQLRTAS